MGGEGREPRPVCLEVTQLEPRLVLHASIHLHSRVRWLIHILSILSTLTLQPPRIQRAPEVGGVGGAHRAGMDPISTCCLT